jgi:hypothetical protein
VGGIFAYLRENNFYTCVGGARGIQSVLLKKHRHVTCSSSMEHTYSEAKYMFIHGGGRQAMLVWDSPFPVPIYNYSFNTVLSASRLFFIKPI